MHKGTNVQSTLLRYGLETVQGFSQPVGYPSHHRNTFLHIKIEAQSAADNSLKIPPIGLIATNMDRQLLCNFTPKELSLFHTDTHSDGWVTFVLGRLFRVKPEKTTGNFCPSTKKPNFPATDYKSIITRVYPQMLVRNHFQISHHFWQKFQFLKPFLASIKNVNIQIFCKNLESVIIVLLKEQTKMK